MRISDERLNHLADAFVTYRLGTLLKITFEQYLADVDSYNQLAFYLLGGGALCAYYRPPKPVGRSPRPTAAQRYQTAI
ncbi:hypothetical protein [Syntrophotalea acetylenica]|jgi:hypothetical protein|uniref:hypothetical protein n=1 Tax=Syntrophotalea acetylenica TaxID=29542 RepID=UPI002A3661FB|nr:hypothetical protein [Syntrophotalea acetylenica]MDY0262007.1 hypothetical protein [Syntrophotalea acetylenica]